MQACSAVRFHSQQIHISAAVKLAIGVAVIAGFTSQHKSGAASASASAADGPSVPYHLVPERRAANQVSGSGTKRHCTGWWIYARNWGRSGRRL